MPMKAKRPCSHPGCNQLATAAYCDMHSKDKHGYDKYRGSSSERGYDSTWTMFRVRYLRHNPLCADCLREGSVAPAADVHHIHKLRDGGSRLDESNCMALCHRHHSARTARGE